MCLLVEGDMELEGKLDVIRVDLQPSEQYKSVSVIAMTYCETNTTLDGTCWT